MNPREPQKFSKVILDKSSMTLKLDTNSKKKKKVSWNLDPPEPQEPQEIVKNEDKKQRKSWFFTFNNYKESDIDILLDKFNEICEKFLFQREKGKGIITEKNGIEIQLKEGTEHLQGVIFLKKAMRWSEFKLPNVIHWEGTRSKERAKEYCQKADTALGQIWSLGIEIKKKIEKHKIMYTEKKDFYPFQLEIQLIIDKYDPLENRLIYLIHDFGIGDIGKSTVTRYNFAVNKNICLFLKKGKENDIVNAVCNFISTFDKSSSKYVERSDTELRTIIFDIKRETKLESLDISTIELLKDGQICNYKFNCGSQIINSPTIIIFTNEMPSERFLRKATLSRWRIGGIRSKKDSIEWKTAEEYISAL